MTTLRPEITLAAALRAGQRRALARAITLIESTRLDHQTTANALLENLIPYTGNSIRIGISGVPGVGKSTFIEAFGNHIIDAGHRVAVLSIDPSSALTGGSILGDKTRMETLSTRSEAFIRPSPAGSTLGGVARRTREAMLLCEAAGFDVIIVETVGVGQSEATVAEMTDMFLLLLLPGGGDDLQGIKRGIMELADLILVNKADGELMNAARRAAADYRMALSLFPNRSPNWKVAVKLCSALSGTGIPEAWDTVKSYRSALSTSGEISSRRASQARAWMWTEVADSLMTALKTHPEIRRCLPEMEGAVTTGRLPPVTAAQQMLKTFLANDQACQSG